MRKSPRAVLVPSLVLLSGSCGSGPTWTEPPPDEEEARPILPAQADWVDCGPIFGAGTEGQWDRHLWGGFASTVVKRDGVFYLYYQGSSGYDEAEATVTRRSIGLATSADGVTFTKHPGNPVVSWSPSDQPEEGAVSAAVLDGAGELVLYYGANTWAGGSEVHADGRLAVSTEGASFTDLGMVLDRRDAGLWGSGDELFPIVALYDGGRWVVYYVPNGVPEQGRLGAAWGEGRGDLRSSAAAQADGNGIHAWGPGSVAQLEPGVHAIFINNVYAAGGPLLEVRTVSPDAPAELSAPLRSYRFPDVWEAVVLLAEETRTWFMYYRSRDHARYGVKVAAADGRTVQCPSR